MSSRFFTGLIFISQFRPRTIAPQSRTPDDPKTRYIYLPSRIQSERNMPSYFKRWFESLLQSGPLRIAVIYLVLGLFWILLSDEFVFYVLGPGNPLTRLSQIKGFTFVIITAILLYIVIVFYFRKNEEEHERYRALTENSRDIIYEMSLSERRLVYVSPASFEVSGYSPKEFIDNPRLLPGIIHPESQAQFQETWARLLYGNVSREYEYKIVHKSGEIRWVSERSTIIRDDEGDAVAVEGAITDITERKSAEEQINLGRRKLALMTDVTYQDIQNKVTALRAYVQLSKNSRSEQDRVALIDKESDLLESIHSLIKKTKDYQQMGMDQSLWIPVEKMIRHQWAQISNKNTITLDCNLPGLEIYADPIIDHVFFNLMQNALQHGKTLSRISFSSVETSEGIVIVCEDDGIGISPEEKPEIFDRVVGKGKFGLFFVHELLTLVGMQIKETGTPGKGTRFEITVPKRLYRITGVH